MPLIVPKRLAGILVGITLACSEGPSGLSTGDLLVTVSGLPAGSSAELVVTGPDGFEQQLAGSQTLSQLSPGEYTVSAHQVAVGSALYTGMPEAQTVEVGGSTANADILYSTGGGNLKVTINGLGTSHDAAVTVTGPNRYSKRILATQTLASLAPGNYTVSAQQVTATGGTPHSASPAAQRVAVPSHGTASATVTYAPPNSGALNLRIAGLYLTQSTQTYDGAVPLVKDRDGYLRVFAVANRTNSVAPAVQVRIYNSSNTVVSTVQIPASSPAVPTALDESQLSHSWNTPVAGALVQPGFRIEAEVDPTGAVPESDETDNLSAPSAPTVQTVPTLQVTFVPVVQKRHAARGDAGQVTDANKDQFLSVTRRMHPIAGYNATVRAPYTTTTRDTLQDDNRNGAWGTVLGELEALRTVENPSQYYYGVAKVSYTNGVAGVAYVSGRQSERSALGWDHLPSASAVAAHELGHNWGRNHAPCGGPGGVDGHYPRPDGRTGSYGIDVVNQTLKPPTLGDIMGYCDPKWIGDYTYRAVMDYLVGSNGPVIAAAVDPSAQPCLLGWGPIRDGEMVLEPSFLVHTRPSLPRSSGPYRVEAGAEDGTSLFDLSFAASEIADARGNQQNFVFAVPISDAASARLATLRLSGRGRTATQTARRPIASGAQLRTGLKPLAAQARRTSGGRVALSWDLRAHPMVMVRDAETGEILSFARDGSVEVASLKRSVDLVFSDGVKSQVKRVLVSP